MEEELIYGILDEISVEIYGCTFDELEEDEKSYVVYEAYGILEI